jgi:hypothetical protein
LRDWREDEKEPWLARGRQDKVNTKEQTHIEGKTPLLISIAAVDSYQQRYRGKIRYTACSKYSRAIRCSRMELPVWDTTANTKAGPLHGKDKVLLGCPRVPCILLSDSMTVTKTPLEQALSISIDSRCMVIAHGSIAEFARVISFLTYPS